MGVLVRLAFLSSLSQYEKNEYGNNCLRFFCLFGEKLILLFFNVLGSKYIIFMNYKFLKEQKLCVQGLHGHNNNICSRIADAHLQFSTSAYSTLFHMV